MGVKLETTDTGLFAFKGRTLIYIGTEYDSKRPVKLQKVLTNEELKRIDENPEILRSGKELYHLLKA